MLEQGRNERNRGTGIQARCAPNIAINSRRVSSGFLEDLIDQWEREGRPGMSPVDRQYPLDELSKMATEWLQTRNTLH